MTELRGLHELFETSTARLKVQPQNLDHLSESWNLMETMKKDIPTIEAKVTAPYSTLKEEVISCTRKTLLERVTSIYRSTRVPMVID